MLVGTRFYAAAEALPADAAKARVINARAEDTVRTRVFDIARGYDWPQPYTGRAIRNRLTERWHGRESELEQTASSEQARYAEAAAAGDFDTAVVFAGEGLDLIRDVRPAAEIVASLVAEAEQAFRRSALMTATDELSR